MLLHSSGNEVERLEISLRRMYIPTRLACFFDHPGTRDALLREIPETHEAAGAGRFLVEYAASTPPSGMRAMSLSAYDELLAIASEIIHWGGISDVVNYDIAEAHLEITSTGRLEGITPQYVEAGVQFLPEEPSLY